MKNAGFKAIAATFALALSCLSAHAEAVTTGADVRQLTAVPYAVDWVSGPEVQSAVNFALALSGHEHGASIAPAGLPNRSFVIGAQADEWASRTHVRYGRIDLAPIPGVDPSVSPEMIPPGYQSFVAYPSSLPRRAIPALPERVSHAELMGDGQGRVVLYDYEISTRPDGSSGGLDRQRFNGLQLAGDGQGKVVAPLLQLASFTN